MEFLIISISLWFVFVPLWLFMLDQDKFNTELDMIVDMLLIPLVFLDYLIMITKRSFK